MPVVKYQVNLDLLTVNCKMNGPSKAKNLQGVKDINHCHYEHRKTLNPE